MNAAGLPVFTLLNKPSDLNGIEPVPPVPLPIPESVFEYKISIG